MYRIRRWCNFLTRTERSKITRVATRARPHGDLEPAQVTVKDVWGTYKIQQDSKVAIDDLNFVFCDGVSDLIAAGVLVVELKLKVVEALCRTVHIGQPALVRKGRANCPGPPNERHTYQRGKNHNS